ncbi:MAG TPA: zf-HC2 domain-containing protein [Polyangiaceae bacterium]|nr:zf-HC2 domain-containing protein [Polyangiaceae bacterium]
MTPLPLEQLHDYFAGELARDEEELLEEHVFGCESCVRTFEKAAALAGGLRSLVPPVISHEKLEALQRAGENIVLTQADPGVPAVAHFSPGVSLLVHVLRGDLRTAERVHFELLRRDGGVMMTLEDVVADRERGEVLIVCQRHYEHAFSDAYSFRIVGEWGGSREVIGDYFIEHIWR